MAGPVRARGARWWPLLWSTALALLLLGGALGPGYVVRYDLVWVPDLALRPDFLGVGSGLPRAVPSDAVVAVLDLVLPGVLLQKVVLLGALVGAGTGAARLLPGEWTGARTVVTTLAIWNPYVVERLLIGHWPVLLGYAALPWVVVAARRWRSAEHLPASLPLLLVVGSLSAGAGLVAGIVLLTLVVSRRTARRTAGALAMVLAANAPWLVSGLLHATDARSDAAGAAVFALSDAGSLPGPVAALGLGGIWNAELVPPSQTGVSGWAFVVLALALGAVGLRSWWRRARTREDDRRELLALAWCWAVGYGVAVLTWALPDAVGSVAETLPGGGLIRDGARWLALCAPLVLLAAGHAAQALLDLLRDRQVPRVTAAAVLAVLPVTFLPDAALGVGGRLETVDYPAAYAEARTSMQQEGGAGDVVLLPLSSYRAPAWADGTKVLDAAGRYLTRDYVASDELVVSGRVVAGEDPRVPQVAGALAAETPEGRAEALAEVGIGWVATTARGAPEVAGEVIVDAPELRLVQIEAPVTEREVPPWWIVAMGLAWLAYAGLMVVAAARGAAGARRASLEVSAG